MHLEKLLSEDKALAPNSFPMRILKNPQKHL